ncbi:MAG: MFS transporter [Chloroflexi bacterium]|nr:MFS transporter [Chloroflexota bacterium]
MATVLPIFYSAVAGKNLPGNLATVYYGYTTAIAMLLIALIAPVIGAIGDYTGAKKRFLAGFAIMGMFFTAMLYFVGQGDWQKASIFFILGNVGFSAANIFYDGLLPHVATKGDIDQVSTRGYALGYLGGGLLLAVNLAMIMKPALFGLPNAEMASRWSFVTVAIWWGIFSIPLFRYVREPKVVRARGESPNPVRAGFDRLFKTMREVRQYRQLVIFILAFWIYNDGIGTIIKMATIYGKEIGIGTTDLIAAILAVQFIGIPCAFLFGRLAKIIGAKRSILFGLGVYAAISVGGYFMQTALHFWILAVLVGFVQGGTQALSRSIFGNMVPKTKSAEFFGFYNVSSKFAGIVGPAVFAVVGQVMGSSRLSIVVLVVFFVVGGTLLSLVNVDEGVAVARAEDAALLGYAS